MMAGAVIGSIFGTIILIVIGCVCYNKGYCYNCRIKRLFSCYCCSSSKKYK